MLSSPLGRGDPKLGLALREVKDVGAVRKDRRGGEPGVETPDLDLADVGNQRGLDAAGLAEQVVEVGKDLVVGQGFERSFECHATTLAQGSDTVGPHLTDKKIFDVMLGRA